MTKKRILYNLTLHKQRNLGMIYNNNKDETEWEIEEDPRLIPVSNPQNWNELKLVVACAIKGIPAGSAVLIGGMTQLAVLIAELKMFDLYYIILDDDFGKYPRAVPVGFDSHRLWTRNQRYNIEMGDTQELTEPSSEHNAQKTKSQLIKETKDHG